MLGISNVIPDEDLQNNVIKICKNSNILINLGGVEDKRVVVMSANRKHSELMLRSKKSFSSKSKVYILKRKLSIALARGYALGVVGY